MKSFYHQQIPSWNFNIINTSSCGYNKYINSFFKCILEILLWSLKKGHEANNTHFFARAAYIYTKLKSETNSVDQFVQPS